MITRTDLGFGRGWLDAPAAESVRRVDRQLGRPLDVNSAGRTQAEQAKMYARYLAGGPFAFPPGSPYAIHPKGRAVDTDDTRPGRNSKLALLNENGWFQTALAKGEWWHLEYDHMRDRHLGAPAGGEVPVTPPPAGQQTPIQEDDMLVVRATGDVLRLGIKAGHTFIDTGSQPIVLLSGAEVGGLEYWKSKGIPYRLADWTAAQVDALVRVRGMRPFDGTGRTDYTKVKY